MWVLIVIAIVIVALVVCLAKSGRIIVKQQCPDDDSDSEKVTISAEFSKTYTEIQADDDFSDNYSYKADSLMGKYEDACKEAEDAFRDMFDLRKRIKLLEKAILRYSEWKDFCYEKGEAGKRYFDDSYCSASKYAYVPSVRDMSGDYVAEYENADFSNIDFLKSVLDYYVEHPEESEKHLHDEYVFYCGGPDEYEFLIRVKSLQKDLLKAIRQNDGILQKDLYGMFEERMKPHIQKSIKELSAKGKVISVKSGNSYMLTIRK